MLPSLHSGPSEAVMNFRQETREYAGDNDSNSQDIREGNSH